MGLGARVSRELEKRMENQMDKQIETCIKLCGVIRYEDFVQGPA